MTLQKQLLENPSLQKFFSGRRRFQIAWVFAFFLIINAKQYPSWLGVLICFLGASLRFSSSGFLRKEAKLAVGGPYAYTRNPLYLGTFLMGVGATLSVGAIFLTLVMGAFFFLSYHYTIQHEEEKLPGYFGQSYLRYCQLVPRFFPRLTPPDMGALNEVNPDPEVKKFSFELAKQNKAFEAYVAFFAIMIGMFALVWLKYRLRVLSS